MELYRKYFVPFPTLVSGGVVLRKIKKQDAAELYDYCRREESCRYSEWYRHKDKSETKEYIDGVLSSYRRQEGFTFVVTADGGRVIGTASFAELSENYRVVEIGYGINSDFWRRGYGSDTVRGLCFFAFTVMGAERVWARVLPENTASTKLLSGLGFKYEGTHRREIHLKGAWRSVAVYSMLREEYSPDSVLCLRGKE